MAAKENKIWMKIGIIAPVAFTLIMSILAYTKSSTTSNVNVINALEKLEEKFEKLEAKFDDSDKEKEELKKELMDVVKEFYSDIALLKTATSNNSISINYMNDGYKNVISRIDHIDGTILEARLEYRSAKNKK